MVTKLWLAGLVDLFLVAASFYKWPEMLLTIENSFITVFDSLACCKLDTD